ncbi:NAD(P)-binding protein [Tuber magnatum]|uniref:NAD(P)-binding protein n=1 Tax=Tuber magnatum TaxID=42249 RepID=A0A317SVC1_9PEZI|nr:NAD(P)-binding protein [Tuber magnatum]
MANPLSKKLILITGASRGIGLSISQKFAHSGASLILVSRTRSHLDAALSALPPGGEHQCIAGDVGDPEFWEGVRGGCGKKLDVLVNAAGITHSSLLMATKPQTIEEVIRTNLVGSVLGCRAVLGGMVRARSGCIINISSVLGIKAGMGSVAYAASKAGVIGLTRSLAAEVGRSGVRVNAILPGYIDTDMTSGMTEGARREALEFTPMKRMGTAEEVADAAVFLALNKFANGSQIVLDGGLSST